MMRFGPEPSQHELHLPSPPSPAARRHARHKKQDGSKQAAAPRDVFRLYPAEIAERHRNEGLALTFINVAS